MEYPIPITTKLGLLEKRQQQQQQVTIPEPASPMSLSSSSSCSTKFSIKSNPAAVTPTTNTIINNNNIRYYDPTTSLGIETPDSKDVICGRGKMTVDHPGNVRFRQLISERKDAYQKAKRRDDKTRITFELVHAIRNGPEGGRFLLFDLNTKLWYEVGDDYAREKVSHSLRQRSRPSIIGESCSSFSSSSSSRRGGSSSSPSTSKQNKARKKTVRKIQHSPALDQIVSRLIEDQQQLLKSMIEKETSTSYTSCCRLSTSSATTFGKSQQQQEDFPSYTMLSS